MIYYIYADLELLNSWADKSQGCVCGYLLVFLQEYKNSYTNHL